jgi:hypothetical protein
MKKKAIVIAALVLGITGGGVYLSTALFSDTENSANNTFAVGTLDLEVGTANGTAFESINVANVGADGTVSGTKSWVITNSGTVPGNLTFQVNDIQNFENGCNEPELKKEIADYGAGQQTCGNPGLGEGEFGAALAVKVFLDQGEGFSQVVSSTMANANQAEYATQWNTNAGTVTIPGGESVTVKMDWATDPSAYGNEIQSDSLAFGLQYDLLQVVPQ